MNINTMLKMPSGHSIPALGYGVYQTPAGEAEDVVLHAFKSGYRHVDSARVYRNEQPCADAIRKSGIPRGEIFLTSKVPPRSMGYDATKAAIQSSFSQTGLDYIDLYLVHAPYGGPQNRRGTWRALVEAQQAGKIRSIGVSNYGVHHLNELEGYIKELETQNGAGKGGEISVGQWELHPWLARPDIVVWCKERGIVIEAYCPIVRGQRFGEPSLQKLVKAHGKTPAQVLLRWSLQKGFVPLPKSVTHSRIVENADVYDFELSQSDMQALETTEYSPVSWDPTVDRD
ncbi:uncharacterized protein KY384_001375 [Bacidia gigantensis]|uniref:uncharacterized protein n=1 Tax=Bacidia gigantensis TaxID=2732470 RepID=UPI001D051C12|nr:uncharacterized protein KY384_001375 [Bacidia gigantensis]KAG8533634.1 hypothetical protein KY384_001375 [Bacidia gigantensis]